MGVSVEICEISYYINHNIQGIKNVHSEYFIAFVFPLWTRWINVQNLFAFFHGIVNNASKIVVMAWTQVEGCPFV